MILIFLRDWLFMNKAPVSTSPPLLAKQVRTVVLNLWVATPRGSDDAFTGVADDRKHR